MVLAVGTETFSTSTVGVLGLGFISLLSAGVGKSDLVSDATVVVSIDEEMTSVFQAFFLGIGADFGIETGVGAVLELEDDDGDPEDTSDVLLLSDDAAVLLALLLLDELGNPEDALAVLLTLFLRSSLFTALVILVCSGGSGTGTGLMVMSVPMAAILANEGFF